MSPPPIKTRVRLLEGQSGGHEWIPDDDVPGARVDIGSDSRASWRISAPGVHPHHFQLYWDGIQLWAADLHGVGDLEHNGQPFRDWEALNHGSRVTFGRAAIEIRGPSAQAIAQAREAEEEDSVSMPNALALGTLPGAPTKLAQEAKLKAANTQLVGLPEHGDINPPTPAPRPVAGAGVERVDRSSEVALAPASGEHERPRFLAPPPVGETTSGSKGPLGHPLRTWILGGALAIGVLVVLFMDGESPITPPATTDGGVAEMPAPLSPFQAQIEARHLDMPTPETIAAGTASPARQAADALIGGREWEAADLYAGLAADAPDDESYAIILDTLRHRLQLRCDADPEQEGDRCAR